MLAMKIAPYGSGDMLNYGMGSFYNSGLGNFLAQSKL